MMSPKKMKYRKAHKGRIKGPARKGTSLSHGDYGLQAVEGGRITARQIEAARIALTRHIKRGGNVWIKIFPHKPVTKKPAEVRMGSGKGSVEFYVAMVRPGRIIYEMRGVERAVARKALLLAASKLPIKTKLLMRGEDPWISGEVAAVEYRAEIPEEAAPAAPAVAAPATAPAGGEEKGKGKKS